MPKLICQTLKVKLLTEEQVSRMYEVFQKYYANTSLEVFNKDLAQKDIVFLLIDKESREIQGFSTLMEMKVEVDQKIYTAAFSGDTIVEKKYWGQGALGVAFLKYLFMQKLKNPLKPYYWFLISKGFKTYLLMANNFMNHYPRYEKETPAKEKKILDKLANELYGKHYNAKLGVIEFSKEDNKDSLKDDVAPITVEMLRNERISFFIKKNNEWAKGNELACLAEMTLLMPVFYQVKVILKNMFKAKKTESRVKVYKRENL